MGEIVMQSVGKSYGDVEALRNIDLVVEDGEFLVLVGPSGCGKSTLLRMIAGLEDITGGAMAIDGKVVNHLSARSRNVAMIFQNYALYPHMTVRENIGFSLKIGGVDKAERNRRVEAVASSLELTDYLDRKPRALSGGQRQRVAMGRAIIREPAVFLMDEPLSNLDAKLRVQMRAELRELHRRLGITTVYVTHDQTEALTLGDRVVVMRPLGSTTETNLQQVAKPAHLFAHPENVFIAGFIGSPAMNLLLCELEKPNGRLHVRVGDADIALPEPILHARPSLEHFVGQKVILGIRPTDFSLATEAECAVRWEVTDVELLGEEVAVSLHVNAPRVASDFDFQSGNGGISSAGLPGTSTVLARLPATDQPAVGDIVPMDLIVEKLHFFDPATGRSI